MEKVNRTMRDTFIEEIYLRMKTDRHLFFLCADFGAPKLDALRNDFKERFINVGIAEQNLINVATGLALEGFTVFAYAIAPFLTMRAFEQIRINLSLQAQLKEINVNLIGVGAGVSYDVSGPTHHCLEDIAIMRTLPNLVFFSPSDWVLTKKFFDYSLRIKKPKYMRLDSKPLPQLYQEREKVNIEEGFVELKQGKNLCLVSTGYMTHKALRIAGSFADGEVGVIDVFLLKFLNEKFFSETLKKYKAIITLEEGFINKGGLDALVNINIKRDSSIRLKNLGFLDSYVFEMGNREELYKFQGLDDAALIQNVKEMIK